MNKHFSGIAAVLVAVIALAIPALAQQKHDSNTLSKIGKAIQYPVRKAGENLAVDVHRGTHSKSVVTNRHTGAKYVETPSGHKYRIRHRRHHH
jgi:hypothetical protein